MSKTKHVSPINKINATLRFLLNILEHFENSYFVDHIKMIWKILCFRSSFSQISIHLFYFYRPGMTLSRFCCACSFIWSKYSFQSSLWSFWQRMERGYVSKQFFSLSIAENNVPAWCHLPLVEACSECTLQSERAVVCSRQDRWLASSTRSACCRDFVEGILGLNKCPRTYWKSENWLCSSPGAIKRLYAPGPLLPSAFSWM